MKWCPTEKTYGGLNHDQMKVDVRYLSATEQIILGLQNAGPSEIEPWPELDTHEFNVSSIDPQILENLRKKADGKIDYILVGSVSSEFLDRMGKRSFWYGAKLSASLINLWTGEIIEAFVHLARDHGIGERAAIILQQIFVGFTIAIIVLSVTLFRARAQS